MRVAQAHVSRYKHRTPLVVEYVDGSLALRTVFVCVQVLVTGSLHLVGDVLRLIRK